MSEHYYSRTQKVKSDPLFWDYQLRNFRIRFKTDNGVFSKKEVDFGSRLLIESFQMPEVKGDILGCWLWLWTNWANHCKSVARQNCTYD